GVVFEGIEIEGAHTMIEYVVGNGDAIRLETPDDRLEGRTQVTNPPTLPGLRLGKLPPALKDDTQSLRAQDGASAPPSQQVAQVESSIFESHHTARHQPTASEHHRGASRLQNA